MDLKKAKETKLYNYKESDLAIVKDEEVDWSFQEESQLYICTDKFSSTVTSGKTQAEALQRLAMIRHFSLLELDDDHQPSGIIQHNLKEEDGKEKL